MACNCRGGVNWPVPVQTTTTVPFNPPPLTGACITRGHDYTQTTDGKAIYCRKCGHATTLPSA